MGRGLQSTGRLNEEGVVQALMVMQRYYMIAKAMGADPFQVLATAAVRDAENGPAFVEALRARMPGVTISILSGVRNREPPAGHIQRSHPNLGIIDLCVESRRGREKKDETIRRMPEIVSRGPVSC